MSMRIRFSEIPAAGLDLELSDLRWFPEQELSRRGEIRAMARLGWESGRVWLAGRLELTVLLPCDRCLEPTPFALAADFSCRLEVIDEAAWAAAGDEHLCREEEMDIVHLQEEVVEVADLLRQQLYLLLPVKRLCRADCRGLCPLCGADLNQAPCACGEEKPESPFAVLKKLKTR